MILTDCDGVLLSWVHSFGWWMKRKGYKKKRMSYNVAEQYGITEEKADVLVSETILCENAALCTPLSK